MGAKNSCRGPDCLSNALVAATSTIYMLIRHGTGINLAQCHNSYFRRKMELRKVSQEKEKAQTENDKLMYDLERVATQNNKSQAALEKSQEEVARLQVSSRSTGQRPGQGHDNRATQRLALCSRQNFYQLYYYALVPFVVSDLALIFLLRSLA
jgi:hypothetical protein